MVQQCKIVSLSFYGKKISQKNFFYIFQILKYFIRKKYEIYKI